LSEFDCLAFGTLIWLCKSTCRMVRETLSQIQQAVPKENVGATFLV
jgi:hypothetical protein